jgi:hypothetical protein
LGSGSGFCCVFEFQVKIGFNFQRNNPQFQVTFVLGSNIQNIKMDNGEINNQNFDSKEKECTMGQITTKILFQEK